MGKYSSLLAGRNTRPLSDDEVKRVFNIFLGLDDKVAVRYDPAFNTGFQPFRDESGDLYGEIIFGPDILPGTNIANPNSSLSLMAAAAHELAHYYRWYNGYALAEDEMPHLDEALTSLDAILRYGDKLNDIDIRDLAADAIQRISLFIDEISPE